MNYLTLDLPNGKLVLSNNSVWKSLYRWLDGGTLYSDYYDASNKGDYWKASEHWINIDSSSTYLSFTIEYDFVNASATDSCLCQIKYDETTHGIAVTADPAGLNIQGATTVKRINCDYSNANIKIDIVANLLTKEITTYIHKNGIPLIKVVNDSSYTFTNFVIQAGAIEADTYKLLPTTTKLLNVSVSDDDITYSDFTDAINYVDKFGVAEMWANTKNYISAQLLGKSDVGHTHSASDITSGLATVATSGSYNDLSNKPTIPTVNDATLTIQKNGTNVQTFTANQSTNATANITVPTKTSDLTNDSGFITSDNTKIPLAGSNAISGSLIPATDNSIDIGSSTKNIKMLYTKGITIDGKTVDTDANGNMTFNGNELLTSAVKESSIGVEQGWYLLHGGLLIQWGTYSNANASFSINFHRPYSAIPIVVANFGDAVNWEAPCAVGDNISKTSFIVANRSGSGAWRVNWIAIGKGD